MLQFITNEHSKVTPNRQIIEAIEGGCRWIQIRLKSASDDEIKDLFFSIREKAKETLTTIIINDRVELAKSLASEGVAGVHLGKEDMNPALARELLGPDAIIGVTAHSFNEINNFKGLDIDYIGVGPYAETKTKENLAPILGLEGITEIVMLAKAEGIDFPIVAVGGITLEDIQPLLSVGVNGFAVSGAIANADDIAEMTHKFLNKLPMAE